MSNKRKSDFCISAKWISMFTAVFAGVSLITVGFARADTATSGLRISCTGSTTLEVLQNTVLSNVDSGEFLEQVRNDGASGQEIFAIARVSRDSGEKLPSLPGKLSVIGGMLVFSATAVSAEDFSIELDSSGIASFIDKRVSEQSMLLGCLLDTQSREWLESSSSTTQNEVSLPPNMSATTPGHASSLVAMQQFESEFTHLLPLAFGADGEVLITFDEPWLIGIEPRTGEQLFKHIVDNFDRIAVAPDGDRVAMSKTDSGMQLFSLEAGNVLWRTDTGVDSSFNGEAVFTFGPLGKRIFLRQDSSDFRDVGRISVVDAATGQVSELETDVISTFGVVFSADGQYAFVAGLDDLEPIVEKFDLASRQTVAQAKIVEGVLSKPDPSSDWFVAFNENQLKILDHQLNELIDFKYPPSFDRGERGAVHAFVGKDAKHALLLANTGNFLVVDLTTGQTILSGQDRTFLDDSRLDPFPFAALSQDSTLMAATNWGNWESKLTTFELPQDWAKFGSFSTDHARREVLLESLRDGDLEQFREGLEPELIFGSTFAKPLLHHAAKLGSGEAILALVEAGADIDERNSLTGKSALMVAVEAGNAETATMLLNLGASSDPVSEVGETFISILMSTNSESFIGTPLEVLQSQLSEQFSPDELDDLLVAAAEAGNENTIGTLLTLGADPDHFGRDGLTSLMVAAASKAPGAFERVYALLKWGNADPNAATSEGATALALAIASEADEKIVRTLIAVSDLERGENGSYVWDVAQAVGNSKVLAMLPAQGWKPPNIPMPSVAPIELRLSGNMSKSDIMRVQQELKNRGLYSSSIDGLWGPASRRGLASYFKVVFDDHRSVMQEFCGLVGEDVSKRRDASGDYLGEASFNGLEWVYEGFFVLGVDATLRNPSTGFSVTCELRISDPNAPVAEANFDLWVARINTRDYDVTLDFIGEGRCDDRQRIRSSLYMSGDPVAFDFPCLKTMAGVPVNSSGTATTWRKY